MANSEILQAAKDYIARGWYVFPCHTILENGECSCGKPNCNDLAKHPRTRDGLKSGSIDPAQIEKWFGADAPPSNIGIVTGKISNLLVIDVDVGSNKKGAETWAALIEEQGEPATMIFKTGGNGMHILFKYNSALKTGTNRLGSGIDIRSDSGYIIAPPSKHRSGNFYEVMVDLPLEDLPAYLLTAKTETRGRKRKDDPIARKYTMTQIAEMLKHIPQDDRDTWRHIGIILGREFSRSDEAWSMYVEWSEAWGGKKGRNHDEIMHQAFYEISQEKSQGKELTMGTIIHAAIKGGWTPKDGVVPLQNFIYFAPGNNFIYRPVASFWIKEAVDCAVGKVNDNGTLMQASVWLKENVLATSMTKSPALAGDYIKGFDCREGELIAEIGSAVFNSYRRPNIELGDAKQAQPFIDHVRRAFCKENDAEQFFDYMAHRVQHPEEKPRFALLIAGDQGVGKDTAVEFCVPALGAWNVSNIEPHILDSSFNEFAAATLVRVSEAANLQDMSKWAFNERMKVLIAGSPDHQSINPKYGQKYSIKMHCGVIVTTNHLLTGIYIPPDDRRYDVIECATKIEMGFSSDEDSRKYFIELWEWFNSGGDCHVAAFLHQRDVSAFSAANGQRKTSAHRSVIRSSLASDYWLTDVLSELDEPEVVRSDAITSALIRGGAQEKEYATRLQPAMLRQGYYVHPNHGRKDGRWRYGKKLATVYAKIGAQDVDSKALKLIVAF